MRLLDDAGIRLTFDRRGYRPTISLDGFETKILKPQNIVEMLHLGSRDLGFAGADWVVEKGAELVELVDTALDPVRIVAAAAPDFLDRRTARPSPASWWPPSTSGSPATGSSGAASTAGSSAPTAPPRCSRPRTPTASSTTPRPAPR